MLPKFIMELNGSQIPFTAYKEHGNNVAMDMVFNYPNDK